MQPLKSLQCRFAPEFAIDKMPGPICFRMKSSSSNFSLLTELLLQCVKTTQAHKSWNNSIKAGTLITKSFLLNAQNMKVFCCLWNSVCKQLEGETGQGLTINGKLKITVGLAMVDSG
jgi:hypothetical protein